MSSIVIIKFGSHLYGTDTPQSDLDLKGVHLPSARDIVLQRVKGSISKKRAKGENEKNLPGDVDEESYSLQRYLQLLADGQTVAIDMLFAPPASIISSSNEWEVIWACRERFLSKRSTAFVGYCRQQANKYGIKGSRVSAARDVAEFFAQAVADHGSTTKVWEMQTETICGEHSRIVKQVCNRDGDIGTYFECCNRKVDFNATVKQAHEIFQRIYDNYGVRARKAEDNEGIDWKALSHAVRVGTEALQLLQAGEIHFPLENAEHLRDIKLGKLAYHPVAEEIEDLLGRIEDASLVSRLPDAPDQAYIDDLVLALYGRVVDMTPVR